MNVPVPEVIGHADDRRDHAGCRELRLDPRRESGRPEEALLDGVSERLAVEFEEPDASRVRRPERLEGCPRPVHALVAHRLPLELEVAGGHHISLRAGTDDLRALIAPPISHVRTLAPRR